MKLYRKELEPLDNSEWNKNRRLETTYFLNLVVSRRIVTVPVSFIKTDEYDHFDFAGDMRRKS